MSSLFTLLVVLTSATSLAIETNPQLSTTTFMNCTTTVDAGEDQMVCNPGETVMLDGSIMGDFYEANWDPMAPLANPNSFTPTATITATTTFTLTAKSLSDENLVVNGDFSMGDTGFTSDYDYGTGGPVGTLSTVPSYAIDDNAADTHTQFANCTDHTGGGDMMVVNASGDQDFVWCQTVTVIPDTEYDFSVWITSVVSQNPAQLRFVVNGALVGTIINPSAATCFWQQYSAIWASGASTTADICLVNVNNSDSGNDFAIDDIAFVPVCVAEDEVTITLSELDPTWTSPGMICYNDPTIVLDDLLDASATTGGTWTINGNAATELNPVDFPNPAILEVVYTATEGMCSESDTQNITITAEPTATFDVDMAEACIDESVVVTYTGNSGSGDTYSWNFGGLTATPGAGQGPHTLSATMPGTYTVSLTVERNGCASQVFNQTIEFEEPPVSDLMVSCTSTENSIEFSWPENPDISAFIVNVTSGQSGTPTSPTTYLVNGLSPGETVDISITAFFADNACGTGAFTASCTAILCPNFSALLSTPPAICEGQTAELDLELSGDPGPYEVTYIVDGAPTTVTVPGTTSTISVTPNQTAVVEITAIVNTNFPTCTITPPMPVTVQVDPLLSAGSATVTAPLCSDDASPTFVLTDLLTGADGGGVWTETTTTPSSGGAFNAGAATFDPNGQQPGTYTFQYTQNASTVCPESATTVSITIGATPVADAGEDQDIGCTVSSATLGSTNSSEGGSITYMWETTDGGTIPNPGALVNEVNEPGTYTLTVRDEETGCTATDAITITSSGAVIEVFATAVAENCTTPNSGRILIDSVRGGMGPYLYAVDGGDFSDKSSVENLAPGMYQLIAEDANGCQGILDLMIEPANTFDIALSTTDGEIEPVIPIGEPLQLDLQVGADLATIDTIIWQPAIPDCDGCLNPVLLPLNTTTISVVVINEDGCLAEAALTVVVEESDRIFIPNAFSPNDDGFNDVFFVQAAPEVVQIKEFQIMDRWGNQVFENTNTPPDDANAGWDGTFRGKRLNPGVFVYYVELELVGGLSIIKSGEINLLY